jgi:DNA-binding transcriptional regulator YdaS (Cro superfamily)
MEATTDTNPVPTDQLTCPRCRARLQMTTTASGDGKLMRVKTPPQMELEELEEIISLCGTAAATARMVGYSSISIYNCRKGRQPISHRLALALRRAVAEGKHLEYAAVQLTGRPRAVSPMSVEELSSIIAHCGSIKATARAAGCAASYICQCRQGRRPVSQRIADALRGQRKSAPRSDMPLDPPVPGSERANA